MSYPQQGGGPGYPTMPQGGAPGYPPQQGGGYPPQQQGGYPPQGNPGYPPMGGAPQGYPQQQPGYPQQGGGYPPQQGGYPPQQGGGYPPQQQGGYPPQGGPGYPQMGGAPQGQGYPQQQPQMGGYPQMQQQQQPGNYGASAAMGAGAALGAGYPQGQPQQGDMGGYPAGGQTRQMTPVGGKAAGKATGSLEIGVSCKKLRDTDYMSKSDPFCVLFQNVNGTWQELGRTETLKNTQDPSWQTKFKLDYRFEERQYIKFEIYDWDKKSTDLKHHDFLGRLECTVGQILSSPGKQYMAFLNSGPSKGAQFVITAEEHTANKEMAKIQFGGRNLDKKDKIGKSDPYYIISRMSQGGQFQTVNRSEVIKNNLNPSWAPMSLSMRDLCNGDKARPLKIEVFDFDSSGAHDLIGTFTTDMNALSKAMNTNHMFPLMNPKKQSKKNYRNSGELFVKFFQMDTKSSFVDYVQGAPQGNMGMAQQPAGVMPHSAY